MNMISNKFFLVVFSLVLLLSSVSAGVLKQNVYDPFGIDITPDTTFPTLDGSKQSGVDWERAKTTFQVPYVRFNYPYLDVVADTDLTPTNHPFCKIGGNYKIKVHSDPGVPGISAYDGEEDLFYCKTILNLASNIDLPLSWLNDDVIVYCNDGGLIKNNGQNFDFLIGKLTTYKACIVKNLDKIENNTIIFGYDVGNNIVDKEEMTKFNLEAKTSSVLGSLSFAREIEHVEETQIEKRYFTLPMERVENPNYDSENGFGMGEQYTYVTPDMTAGDDCVEDQNDDSGFSWFNMCPTNPTITLKESFKEEVESICSINGWDCIVSLDTIDYIRDDDILHKSYYSVDVNVISELIYYEYNDSNGKEYYFLYDTYTSLYAFADSDFRSGELINLNEKFGALPGVGNDLTRVLLARNLDGNTMNTVSGFETALVLMDSEESTVYPTYTILGGGLDFGGSQVCEEGLNFYSITENLNSLKDYDIYCGGNQIKINSKQLGQSAFELFKNIIFNIKLYNSQ